jgi:hypothetical protein
MVWSWEPLPRPGYYHWSLVLYLGNGGQWLFSADSPAGAIERLLAAVLMGGRVSKGMMLSSMGGWSRGVGRPLWAAGFVGLAVLYGRLVSCSGPVRGELKEGPHQVTRGC